MSDDRPAWSKESAFLQIPDLTADDHWSPEWAMGGATGAGVRVAVVDSGIEADHPHLDHCIDADGAIDFAVDDEGAVVATPGPHDDVFGHGTACAGIIHALAPEASITSVRVLGPGLRGKAAAFHAGLQWAIEQKFDVINLSLGAGKRDWAFPFHEICDRAYFENSFIVTAANNIQRVSFPSLYASVTSVACNTTDDPLRYHFNPEPPTEFLARGIDVEVPWLNGETTVTTGNSFAAPHIAGFAALIRSKHPNLRPFHVKSLLWACAANVRDKTERFEAADQAFRNTQAVGRGTLMMTVPPSLPATPLDAAPAALDPEPEHAINHAPTEPLDPEAEIESHVADVKVAGLLAEGAWGSVYSGQRSSGERVAIRRVEQAFVGDPSLVERFLASVRTAAELRNPHILPIDELIQLDQSVLIVMPESPSNVAQLGQPVELADACVIALSLLTGLGAAHRHGVFHGDVRPQNALIDANRHVVISDCGLAAPLQSNAQTMVQFSGPEWTHRAPELILGSAVGAHTDVYAVGSMLYEMLAGRPPRPQQDSLAELVAHAHDATPPPPLPPAVPSKIATAVMYALVHDPAYRWPNVADFAASLTAACVDELGHQWAYRSQFILNRGPAQMPGTQTGTVIRAFGR